LIKVRGIRDKVKDEILQAQKSNDINEDEKFAFAKELDAHTKELNEKIKSIGDAKTHEIMTV